MKRNRFFYSIVLIALFGAIFFVYRRWIHNPPPPANDPSKAVSAVIGDQAQQQGSVQLPPFVSETVGTPVNAGTDDPLGDNEIEAPDAAQAELEKVRIDMFKAEAMETLPLLTLHTADPLRPDKPGPKPGEVWIRIQPHRSGETRGIMAQVADLYRSTLRHEKPVTVMLWVGGQPMARFEY